MAGLLVGGVPAAAALGTLATVLAAGATAYRLSLGLALLAFTYPFDLTTWAGPLKLTTSFALMGIIVLLWAAAQARGSRFEWRQTALDVPVLLFAGTSVLSLLGLGGNLQDQLVGLVKAAGGFLMFCIATQSIRERRDLWLVMAAVMATGLLQAIGVTIDLLNGTTPVSEMARATGSVIDANIFAGYLLLIIPLVLVLGLALRPWWALPATMLAAAVFGIALAATLSRSGWLGLLAALVVLVILIKHRRWRLAAVAAALAAAIVLGGLVGPMSQRLDTQQPGGPLEMLASRAQVWGVAVDIWQRHPLFGVGVANFVNYYNQEGGEQDVIGHAHNIFLNMGAERGLFGLLAFIVVIVGLFATLRRALRAAHTPIERAVAVGLIATFAGYFVHSLLEVSYYDYKVLLLFWLLVGTTGGLPILLRPNAADVTA